jgi:hypothetical protein
MRNSERCKWVKIFRVSWVDKNNTWDKREEERIAAGRDMCDICTDYYSDVRTQADVPVFVS